MNIFDGGKAQKLVRALVYPSAFAKAKEQAEAPFSVVVQTEFLALNGYGHPEYHRKILHLLTLESFDAIPQLDDPNLEQKEWVLSRLKQPAKYWRSFK